MRLQDFFFRMSNEGVKHFLQATGFHTSRFSLHLQICISHYLSLFHVALTYLGKPQSHQKKKKNQTPPHPPQAPHLLLPWLRCFQGNSKTEKQCVSRVTNTFDMCVFTSVEARVWACSQTDRQSSTRAHAQTKKKRKKKKKSQLSDSSLGLLCQKKR